MTQLGEGNGAELLSSSLSLYHQMFTATPTLVLCLVERTSIVNPEKDPNKQQSVVTIFLELHRAYGELSVVWY